jgi:Lipocalin-like domain
LPQADLIQKNALFMIHLHFNKTLHNMKTTTITSLAFAAIACACLITASCKKAKTKTELLTDKGWRITSIVSKTDNNPTVDEFAGYGACEKDNILTYATNKVFTEDEGATKCVSTDPQTVSSGSWTFTNNDTELTVVEGTSSTTYKIITLDADNLKLNASITAGGSTFTVDQTLVH